MTAQLYKNFKWGLTGQPQSMLVERGRVVHRGFGVAAPGAVEVDLEGRFLLPALTDCHCHILPTGLDLSKLHLGGAQSQSEVLDQVRDRNLRGDAGWLLAVHYDQNRWGGEHASRLQLDSISSTRPILLTHVNGHAGIANTAALQAAGVGLDEPDPSDGSYGRDEGGQLNGVLLEGAHNRLLGAIPRPTLEESVSAILAAAESMASFGIASATDMQTSVRDLSAYRAAMERGSPVAFRLYVVWKDIFGPRATDRESVEAMRNGSDTGPVIAGVKLFADGAIASGTAAIYGGYEGKAPGENGVSGQLMYTPDRLAERVRTAHEAGFQVCTHAIGDYAIDAVLDAYEATSEPSRHRIEHAMILSDAQIERLAKLGVAVAMQPEFLVRLRHAYRAQLGPERTSRLERYRSVLDAGVPLAFSSDRPICAGNPWTGVDASSRRPEGFDQGENLSRSEAIKRYLTPARKIGGESNSGGLEPGQICQAIVMETDPLFPGTPSSLVSLEAPRD